MMEIRYNFGGFYESQFSELIDEEVYGEKDFADKVNFRKTYKNFSKRIVTEFNGFLEDKYDLDINLEFVELLMPKQYNFTTDTIVVKLSLDDRSKLDTLISNEAELVAELDKAIITATTGRSGFVPFYEYNKVLNKLDTSSTEIYYQLVLDVLKENEFNNYWDYMIENLRDEVYNAIVLTNL